MRNGSKDYVNSESETVEWQLSMLEAHGMTSTKYIY